MRIIGSTIKAEHALCKQLDESTAKFNFVCLCRVPARPRQTGSEREAAEGGGGHEDKAVNWIKSKRRIKKRFDLLVNWRHIRLTVVKV
jgi:hypothetical protein